jgi:DNA-binding LacI/PurR family transcriptional regulator
MHESLGSVALVIPEPTSFFWGHPFYTDAARGVDAALVERSIVSVLLPAAIGRSSELAQAFLCGKKVDGAILVNARDDDPLLARVLESGLPVVLLGSLPAGLSVDSVDIDNKEAAATAVGHLLSLGRRRIGTVTGNLRMTSGAERLVGYREALAAAGIAADPTLIEEGDDYTADRAFLSTERLLVAHPDLDGLFVPSDVMAAAALRALLRANKRVPEDVALIGFDDSAISRNSLPPLSTIRQPARDMGRESVDLLVRRVEDPESEPRRIVLSAELICRESTLGAQDEPFK